MKRLALIFSLFFTIPVNAAEITSKITDSVQLKVDGAAGGGGKGGNGLVIIHTW